MCVTTPRLRPAAEPHPGGQGHAAGDGAFPAAGIAAPFLPRESAFSASSRRPVSRLPGGDAPRGRAEVAAEGAPCPGRCLAPVPSRPPGMGAGRRVGLGHLPKNLTCRRAGAWRGAGTTRSPLRAPAPQPVRGGAPLLPPPFLSAPQGRTPHSGSPHPSARADPASASAGAAAPRLLPTHPPAATPRSSYAVCVVSPSPLPPKTQGHPQSTAPAACWGAAPRRPPGSRSRGAYLRRSLGPAAGAPPGTHPAGSNHVGKPQHRNPGPPWGEAEACPGSRRGGAHTLPCPQEESWHGTQGAAGGVPALTGLPPLRRHALLRERKRAGAVLSCRGQRRGAGRAASIFPAEAAAEEETGWERADEPSIPPAAQAPQTRTPRGCSMLAPPCVQE